MESQRLIVIGREPMVEQAIQAIFKLFALHSEHPPRRPVV
jgi:hypothetical protein